MLEMDLNGLRNLNTTFVKTDNAFFVYEKTYWNLYLFIPAYLGLVRLFPINVIDQKTLKLLKMIMNSLVYTKEIDNGIYSELEHNLKCLKSYVELKYPIPSDVDIYVLNQKYIKIKTGIVLLKNKEQEISILNNLILDTELNLIYIHDCINNLNISLVNFYY